MGALPITVRTHWRPAPLRQFIVKMHSRCDLACDYCYVYTMGDQRWRSRPPAMPPAVVEQLARRIAGHARRHGLDAVDIVLHGGEPLLVGPAALASALETFERHLGPVATPRFTVQTNAMRLDEAILAVLLRHRVGISVSLDGDRTAHDRHRRRADGRGSHDTVAAALRRLSAGPARPLFRGLLCTVDLASPPVPTYEALLAFDPPAIDFLLPHGTWSRPPPGRGPDPAVTPYADWLIAVFDRWYDAPEQPTRVRRFAETMNVLFGGESALEGVGLAPAGSIVVETDGGIETADSLTAAYPGAGSTGLHVARDEFDAVVRRPDVVGRQLGPAGLPPGCRACPVRRTCGGGLVTHRYSAGRGFANPSVYCPDLLRLTTHIRARMTRDVDLLRAGAR